MLKNYFLIAWRSIKNNAGYTFFNITGLAVGLAVFIITLLYVNNETAYDKWDKQLARVYRVGINQTKEGETTNQFWTAYPMGNEMMNTCPEVQAVTRMIERGELLVSYKGNSLYEKKVIMADSSFFTVFPYRFTQGSRLTALSRPNTVILSAAMAEKIFGTGDAIGKTIDVSTAWTGKQTLEVAGVIEKTGPSHLDFNICISYFNTQPNNWGRQFFTTYVLLKPGAPVAALAEKAKTIYLNGQAALLYNEMSGSNAAMQAPGNHPAEWLKANDKLSSAGVFFEAAPNIHLSPKATGWRDAAANHPVINSEAGNSMPVIYFSIAAILVLLLACINYTNLSIARAGKRAKETGMRKVMGAAKRQLISQFLAEAFLQCFAALLLGVLFAAWMIGFVNNAFGLQLQLWDALLPQRNIALMVQLAVVVISVSLLSGLYPAFILSSFQPVKVLKGNISKNIKGRLLRNGLVVLQFAISACFIIGLFVIYSQLKYMRTNDPGFTAQQVLVLNPANSSLISPQEKDNKLADIQNRLLQIPGVTQVTASDAYPGVPSLDVQQATYKGNNFDMNFHYIYYGYFKTLNMPVVAGRDFSTAHLMDSVNAAVINETAVRKLGLKNPVGSTINILLRDYTVIGVLKDNYEAGYNTAVSPAIYAIGAKTGMLGGYNTLLVKLNSSDVEKTTAAINGVWKTIEPAFPLKYSWLDEDFGKLVEKYQRFGTITTMLGTVAMLIALMGIFALSAFMAGQRTKEIGIRKVFGASVAGITAMLSKSFMIMVAIALLIAFPAAYWLMAKWLQGFAYRIQISWVVFLLTGVLVIGLALLTVSIQAIKAAMANPVKSLRIE